MKQYKFINHDNMTVFVFMGKLSFQRRYLIQVAKILTKL